MDEIQSKFFLRSRKIQAALLLGLQALTESGVDLPAWLSTDWLTGLLNSITGGNGLGVATLNLIAAALVLGSWLRPDPIGTTLALGRGDLLLAPVVRAAATAGALVLALLAPAAPADASPGVVFVPPAAAVGRWTWAPADGATAYNVYAARNGGAYALVAAVTAPEVTLPASLGSAMTIVVEPLAPGSGLAPGLLSLASDEVRFYASSDLDGDGHVALADFGALRAAYGLCIQPSASGVAVPAGPCP